MARRSTQTQDLIEGLLTLAETGDATAATQAFSSMIDGCKGLQFAFIDGQGHFNQAACANVDAAVAERMAREFNTPQTNPVIAHMGQLRPGQFTDIETFVDMATLRRSEMYHELLVPIEPNRVAMMSTAAQAGVMSFGLDQDVAAALSQASQVVWVAHQFGRAMHQHILATRPQHNALLLEADGQPLGAHAATLGGTSRGTLKMRGAIGPVVPTSRTMQGAFHEARRAASVGQVRALVLPGECGPCRVSLSPGPKLGQRHVIWVCVSPLRAPAWSRVSLAASYALTPREASVVLALLNGGGIEDIAFELGLSPRSVRTYLSAAFNKTACAGQPELLRKLLG